MIYEYLCKVCSTQFEAEQSIKDPPMAVCPRCNVYCHNRLISCTSFILKGGGWANDNYSTVSKK